MDRKQPTTESIPITCAAGYIGSHTLVELMAAGYEAVCLDIFSNGNPEGLRQVERLVGSLALAQAGTYGNSKALVEQMLHDACVADPPLSVVALRYFNPIAAHTPAA